MNPAVAQSRQNAYLEILHHALVAIRNYAHGGNMRLCEIEAEHVHEIPTLIVENNKARHQYYACVTRPYYLEQLAKHGDKQYLEERMLWYRDAWEVLMRLALEELSESAPLPKPNE